MSVDRKDFGKKIGGVDETREKNKTEELLTGPLLKPIKSRNLKDPGRGSPDKASGMFFIPNHKRCRL